MPSPQQIADEVEARLRAVGTPERAEGEKRYLKSDLEFLGARVPQVRREANAVAKEVATREELVTVAKALWAKPIHERRSCAAYLLAARAELLGPEDLELFERLVRVSRTWALVDVLAGDVLGALLVRRPGEIDLDRWATDEDLWVRRSALLAQIKPLKAGLPFEPFARYAETMLEEREFFIRKAIGWVLREAGKSRPDEVFEWLLPRAARASGVTYREATKYLPAPQVERLATARSTSGPGRPGG